METTEPVIPSAKRAPTPEQIQAKMKKATLMLSRKRVLQELEISNNDRYSELLRRTLADLDTQIGQC